MKTRYATSLVVFSGALVAACYGTTPSTTSSSKGASAIASELSAKHISNNPAHIAARAPWKAAAEAAVAASVPSPVTEAAKTTYPAFTPNGPQVANQGGSPVLAHPEIVTITFNSDPNASLFESFADGLGANEQWTMLEEYGIGAARSSAKDHIRTTLSGTAVTDPQLAAMAVAALADPTSGWPANTGEQIYTFYVPADLFAFESGDTSYPWCQYAEGAAYHTTFQPTNADGGAVGLPITYAILPQCTGLSTDWVTLAASHEFAEASSDPLVAVPQTIAYMGFDQAHLAYGFYQYLFDAEIGDACEFFEESSYEGTPPFTFNMQRIWSNKNELLGHNPCRPAITSEPYYNGTTFASQLQTISVNWAGATLSETCSYGEFFCPATTQGIKVALGQSATFDIGFYSDAPTADWTLVAVTADTLPITDDNGNAIANGTVNVKIENPTGNNGHKARVTVTPLTASPLGVEYIELQSGNSSSYEARTVPILIGQK